MQNHNELKKSKLQKQKGTRKRRKRGGKENKTVNQISFGAEAESTELQILKSRKRGLLQFILVMAKKKKEKKKERKRKKRKK